ncbi:lipoate--protein ligase family protein [Virgibacillus sp. W0430]|uniref:lipoate--protein ligase family protein n=1 Tax=Virgibacillus sp. W0430 TaxID=3391580 RepID=UPI003F470AEC
MGNLEEIIYNKKFRYINHTNLHTFYNKPYTALTSFAIDDALALSVGAGESAPVIRLWSHPKTVVLGIPDTRLPYIEEGLDYLSAAGFHIVVRNSGGLAVPLDEGVLNLSLILPDVQNVSIHDGYEAMYRFIQSLFIDLTAHIKAYEIVGSYCPGDFDLSIDGIKFAGISQRRVKQGAAIQIYLDVEGDSFQRAHHIQSFYTISKKTAHTKFAYPTVDPTKMGSLSTLLGIPITVQDVQSRVYSTMKAFGTPFTSNTLSLDEEAQFYKRYDQMIKRNNKISKR